MKTSPGFDKTAISSAATTAHRLQSIVKVAVFWLALDSVPSCGLALTLNLFACQLRIGIKERLESNRLTRRLTACYTRPHSHCFPNRFLCPSPVALFANSHAVKTTIGFKELPKRAHPPSVTACTSKPVRGPPVRVGLLLAGRLHCHSWRRELLSTLKYPRLLQYMHLPV